MSKVFSFHKKQYELILPLFHNKVDRLPAVYAYYLDANGNTAFFRSDNKNHIEFDDTIFLADDKACKQFCKINETNQKVSWTKKDDIPFFKKTIADDARKAQTDLFAAQIQAKKTNDVFSDLDKNCLCLRVHHSFDGANVCYVIPFTKESIHWGASVRNLGNDKDGLSSTYKKMIENFLYNDIIDSLDAAGRDKEKYNIDEQITKEMMKHKIGELELVKQQLLSMMYSKIVNINPAFRKSYNITQNIENKLLEHCHKNNFEALIRYLLDNLPPNNTGPHADENNDNYFDSKIETMIEMFYSDNAPVSVENSDINESKHNTLTPKEKVMAYLDELEDIAMLFKKSYPDHKLTAKNICDFNPDTNNRFYGKTPASISSYLGNDIYRRIISNLFKKDPSMHKWSLIRTQFASIKKIQLSIVSKGNEGAQTKTHVSGA